MQTQTLRSLSGLQIAVMEEEQGAADVVQAGTPVLEAREPTQAEVCMPGEDPSELRESPGMEPRLIRGEVEAALPSEATILETPETVMIEGQEA